MANQEFDDLASFDAEAPVGGVMLGSDADTIKKINRRSSPVGKVVALVIVVAAIGTGVWAWQQSEDYDDRMAVFEPLEEMEDELARNSALRQILQDAQFEDVKQRAIMNLGHFEDEASVPLLIQSLEEDGVVRRSAAWALAQIGLPAAEPAKPKLLEVLPETNEVDRPRVVWTMAVLRMQDQAAIDALIESFGQGEVQDFEDFEPRVITDVLGLERLSSTALTDHESDAVRLLTANALAEVSDERVVAPLSRLLTNELEREQDDQHVEVIRAAVGGLGRTGSTQAAGPLFQTLQNRPDMRDTVLNALQASTAAPQLAVLVSEASETDIRRELVRLLAATHDRRVADNLAALLQDEDQEIRSTAALALAEFGDVRATPVLFSLTTVEGDDDLVSDAIEALHYVAQPEITDQLVDLLETHAFRKAAIMKALGMTGDPRAARALTAELEGDDVPTAALALAMLDDDASFRKLLGMVERPRDVDMAAYNAADRSLTNEELLRKRKGAILAMGRFRRPEAIEPLMTVVEDDNDDYELRSMAAASIGMIADAETMRVVLGKVVDPSVSEHARRYYVQALWQRPHRELNGPLLDLIGSDAPPEVRRAGALALGYAADPNNDERLIALLDNEESRRHAAFAIVLGGGAEAVQRLLEVLAEDADTREVLQMRVMNAENDWFNLVTEEMFETGAVWRRARAAQLMREGLDDATYSYAWQKMVAVMRSGWDGVGGVTAPQVRDKLWAALSGEDSQRRELAAQILAELPERGLLLRARDEGGPAGETARRVLTEGQ